MAQEPSTQQKASPTQQPQRQEIQDLTRVERKDPWLAALLGLIFGGGHMYLGEWAKGILLLIVAIVVSVLTRFAAAPVFWVISPLWAYYDAKAYNRKVGYPE